jgi:hypothetical protein
MAQPYAAIVTMASAQMESKVNMEEQTWKGKSLEVQAFSKG